MPHLRGRRSQEPVLASWSRHWAEPPETYEGTQGTVSEALGKQYSERVPHIPSVVVALGADLGAFAQAFWDIGDVCQLVAAPPELAPGPAQLAFDLGV